MAYRTKWQSFRRTRWIRRPVKGVWAYEWQILGLVIQLRHRDAYNTYHVAGHQWPTLKLWWDTYWLKAWW